MTTMKILEGDDPLLAGNWYPFPPPGPGFYDFRKLVSQPADGLKFEYYDKRRVYEGVQKRLLSMGVRLSRMRADQGWQFRFIQQVVNGVPTNWRPIAVVYDLSDPQAPRIAARQDISGQLPFARSIDEARYIVRQIPERWPVFRQIHVEYTEEKLQS